MNQKILQGILIVIIILGIGYLGYSFISPYLRLAERVINFAEEEQAQKQGKGTEPIIHEVPAVPEDWIEHKLVFDSVSPISVSLPKDYIFMTAGGWTGPEEPGWSKFIVYYPNYDPQNPPNQLRQVAPAISIHGENDLTALEQVYAYYLAEQSNTDKPTLLRIGELEVWRFIHPDDSPLVLEDVFEINGESYNFEYVISGGAHGTPTENQLVEWRKTYETILGSVRGAN